MSKNKINHPFQAPDIFFDDFKKETIEEIESLPQGRSRKLKFMFQLTKYAAIIVFSFFLGRISMSVFNEDDKSENLNETYTIDEVLLQITDEDITDFILEEGSLEI